MGDVVRMIDHDTIFSESTAEAHLGRPDHNQKYSDNRPVWWYSIDAQGGYLRLDFDSAGRLASHEVGPPSEGGD